MNDKSHTTEQMTIPVYPNNEILQLMAQRMKVRSTENCKRWYEAVRFAIQEVNRV